MLCYDWVCYNYKFELTEDCATAILKQYDFSKNKNLNVHTYCENLKEIYIEVVLGQAKEILPM